MADLHQRPDTSHEKKNLANNVEIEPVISHIETYFTPTPRQ